MEKCQEMYEVKCSGCHDPSCDGYKYKQCGGEMIEKRPRRIMSTGPRSTAEVVGTAVYQCAKCKDIQFV